MVVPVVKFPIFLCVRSLSVLILILVLIWNVHYRGGLALFSKNKALLFNVHPVMMVTGLLLLNGEAMIAYKTISGTKTFKKLVHLSLQFLAFILSLIGLWAVWKFHNDKGIGNFYSLHSWLGLASLLLFAIQWGVGFATFWCSCGSTKFKGKMTFLQMHKIISHYCVEAILVNVLGVLMVVLGGFVIFGVVSPTNGKGDVVLGSIELEEQAMV
ncbi:transmembrane ascorbate ferrireductase 2 isoform X2 [Lactuca sativa]|uniref:transmembrane ascorbate ferrireductase 2 isoform X2 n=1 Tax=Lactuca sativa TaxID=4236 RepID=UPI000CD9F0C8|nr:transmembrane ascorbate ferrireductase 2 isoform X2 [Lactuca sativa]